MLLASNPCRVQLAAARAALEDSLARLEGLVRSVLAKAEADEAMHVAQGLRESADAAVGPLEAVLDLAEGGDGSPPEREALERAARDTVRELEALARTAARLAREVELRILAAA